MIFVLVLSPQHMVYEDPGASTGWLLCAGVAALLVFFAVVQTIRTAAFPCTQRHPFPVLRRWCFCSLPWQRPRPELFRPAAGAADAAIGAGCASARIRDVRRDIVYASPSIATRSRSTTANFRQPRLTEENCSGGIDIPPASTCCDSGQRDGQPGAVASGRVYEPLFLYESAGSRSVQNLCEAHRNPSRGFRPHFAIKLDSSNFDSILVSNKW